jgi:hypothetical protein
VARATLGVAGCQFLAAPVEALSNGRFRRISRTTLSAIESDQV